MKNEATNVDATLRRFHRSLYLSLAAACACLVYAEWLFLPELTVLGGIAAVMLIIGYRLEGRWALSLRAANIVGAVIAVILALWGAYQFIRPHGSLIDLLPWPVSLLPYLGPLVMILIPAKLFRPKHNGDYWSLQLIGLMTVALACALANDSKLAALVFVYVVCAVWCVTDFHAVVCRGNGRIEGTATANPPTFLRVGAWTVLAASIAITCSLITPRSADAQWGIGGLSSNLTIGYSEDRHQIDLNMSGEVQASTEVAFEVRAEAADGQPKLDISPAQRWRGSTFNYYDQGRWTNRGWSSRLPQRLVGRGNPRDWIGRQPEGAGDLPDLGPQKYFLIFPVPSKPRGTCFLGEPVWPPRIWIGSYPAAPVVTETDSGGRFAWLARAEGDVFPPPVLPGTFTKAHYRQVTAPTPEPGLSAAMNVDPTLADHLTILTGLRQLKAFSNTLMQELVDKQLIPKYVDWSPGEVVAPNRHEEVARAIDSYLRTSGRFEYSLTLNRVDANIDPIEDFLLNVRQGHCNRFATALALLLRSQGIPARIVLGFEGAESNGDGTYVVRQAHAHSWVEALIRRPNPAGNPTWHWLTLDPSPEMERLSMSDNSWSRWFEELGRGLGDFFRNFILDLNSERQDRARNSLAMISPLAWGPPLITFLSKPIGWVTLSGLAGGTWFLRKRRPRGRLTKNDNYYFNQFRDVLRQSGMVTLQPGMTPKELGRQFRGVLKTNGEEVADAARRIIEHHDETRYGGRTTSSAELPALDKSLRYIKDYCQRRRNNPVAVA